MKNLISKKIIKFIYNNIIYKYKIFGYIKLNKKLKFKKWIIKELNKFNIK